MGFFDELLRLKSFVEAHLYFYLIDRFPVLKNGTDFKLYKTISVPTPFGKIETRDQNGLSQLQPEICVTSKTLGFVAEAAAWDDDSKYGNDQSEAHESMHKIGLEKNCVYFAQKVVCQVLPAFLYCREKATDCHAFISVTENHKSKMNKVLGYLFAKAFIASFERPLENNNDDVKNYHQIIYELKFPESSKCITDKIANLINNDAEPGH